MNLITIPLILTIIGSGNTGTAVLPLMKIGQGPRAAAMGESFTGLADDASAVYWNPAGLGQLTGYQFALSHHQWFFGITDEVFHAAVPLGPGALGFGAVYSSEPDVMYWDEELNDFSTYRAWTGVLTAGYGVRFFNDYRFGLTAKGMYEALVDGAGIGGGIDVGLSGTPVKWLGLGVAARHVGIMSFDEGTDTLPVEIAGGVRLGSSMFNATVDAVYPLFDNDPNFRAGVEFSPVPALALRAGYRNGPVDLEKLGYLSGLTAGIGVTVAGFGIDYAFVPYGELGMTHRLGIRIAQGGPADAGLIIHVVDADTRVWLNANVAVSGVIDSTATASVVNMPSLKPGKVFARASLEGYEPDTDTFLVRIGKVRVDTLFLRRLRSHIKGGIYDAKTKEPIGGALVYRGPMGGRIPVPPDPGTFEINDVAVGSYVLDASGPTLEYLPQTCTLSVPAGVTVERDFYLWRKSDFLVLEGVNFETGKADILPQFYPIIDRAGQILKQTTDIRRVELAGHTDPRDINTPEFPSNWELSDARANAVRTYLIEKWGIAGSRLSIKGYADTQPLVPNTSMENMYKNRRTELRILE
jgi:outer membrane protein OmpA-like peptidoglycan-associated protein